MKTRLVKVNEELLSKDYVKKKDFITSPFLSTFYKYNN